MPLDSLLTDVRDAATPDTLERAADARDAVAAMYGEGVTANVQVVRPLVMQKHGSKSEQF